MITATDGTRRVFSDEVVQGELRSIHRFARTREPLPAFVFERLYMP